MKFFKNHLKRENNLNIISFWRIILANTKEDIIKSFLKDLESYNRIFNKIEKAEEFFSAIIKKEGIKPKEFKKLYVDFKINHTELLLEELKRFVDDLELKYAYLNDSWTLIDGHKQELREIKTSRNVDSDSCIKKCEEIIKVVYTEYRRLQNEKKKEIRKGFVKFFAFYGSIYGALSTGFTIIFWDWVKDNTPAAILLFLFIWALTWNYAKTKFWRKE